MRSDAGMANRHEDVDLRFAQVSASSGTLAWLGLAWLGLAWLGLAWLGLSVIGFPLAYLFSLYYCELTQLHIL